MPSKTKYEIRSQEVQEVLNTPPRFLIFWGNAFIMVLFLVGLLFLGRYKIAQKANFPAQLTKTNGALGIIVDTTFSAQLKAGQKVKFKTKDNNFISEGSIKEIFDTSIDRNNKKYLTLSGCSSNDLPHKSNSDRPVNIDAEVQVGEESFLHLFVSKIFGSHH